MKIFYILLILALVGVTFASAIPKDKKRVVDVPLTDEEHFDDEEEHNPEYDHEAFLGKDQAREFEDLTPEESKEKLGKIYDKIDKDSDGKVSEEELKNWIKVVQYKYIKEDTDRQWQEHEINEEGLLTWASYKKKTYGTLENMLMDRADPDWEPGVMGDTDEEESHYKEMIDRDSRRWKRADKDSDGLMSREEFTDFLHPEEADHMKDIVVEETLEDIDKDKDGKISEEEYIGDFYPDDDDDEPEPEWLEQERQSFLKQHDKDGDGQLDRKEIQAWIIPDDYDHTHAEATHLITEADTDQDGFLTKEEVVDKYDLFVGSQATDFGEALTRHDEF